MISAQLSGAGWLVAHRMAVSVGVAAALGLAVGRLQAQALQEAREQLDVEIYFKAESPSYQRTGRTRDALKKTRLIVSPLLVKGGIHIDKAMFEKYYPVYAELGTRRMPAHPYWRTTQKLMRRHLGDEAKAGAIAIRSSLMGR